MLHFLAVCSPGQDFTIVVKQSLTHGRRVGYFTSAGIATGIIYHVMLGLLGLSIILKSNHWLYLTILVSAALYLIYLGYGAIQAGRAGASIKLAHSQKPSLTAWQAFQRGLLTNILNAKATLFFFTLFTTVISPDTTLLIKSFYGLYFVIATGIWFGLLTYFITFQMVQKRLQSLLPSIETLLGIALIWIGLHILWTSVYA